MPAISMVTAMAMDSGNNVGLETIMGIKPGDVLELAVPGGGSLATKIATLATSFPPNPPATTDTWRIDAICQSASSSVAFTDSIDIFSDCQASQTSLVVIAIATQGSTPVAYATQTVQVAASGNTIVNFPDGWHTDLTSFQQTLTNAPAGTLALRPIFKLEVAGESWFPFDNPVTTATAGSGSTQSYLYPTGVATGGTYGVEAHFTTTDPMPVSQWQQIATTLPATDTHDIAMTLLPAITSTGVSATTSVRPKAVWSAAGPMTHATFGTAALSWPSGAAHGNWFVIFPPTTTSPVELPALPDALAAYRPPTDGSVSSTPSISFSPTATTPTTTLLARNTRRSRRRTNGSIPRIRTEHSARLGRARSTRCRRQRFPAVDQVPRRRIAPL